MTTQTSVQTATTSQTHQRSDARKSSKTQPPPSLPPAGAETDDEARYRPIEWSLVRRLIAFLKPYKKTYVTAIVIGLVHVLLDMLTPTIIKWIVDLCTDFLAGRR